MSVSLRVFAFSTFVALVLVGGVRASRADSATLVFESEALSLASGETRESAPSDLGAGDVRIAYHAERATKAVVLAAREGVEIAFLAGAAYASIDGAAVAAAAFSPDGEDRAFGAGDTVLVRTPDGAVWKLGNPSENDESVSFDYESIQ